jgi:hypothetical protein
VGRVKEKEDVVVVRCVAEVEEPLVPVHGPIKPDGHLVPARASERASERTLYLLAPAFVCKHACGV